MCDIILRHVLEADFFTEVLIYLSAPCWLHFLVFNNLQVGISQYTDELQRLQTG
jgi:hypothetical protein